MKGELIIIRTNGSMERRDLTAAPELEELQKAVGGYIEKLPHFSQFEGKPAVAFCNEEGKLRGLDLNPRATEVWASNTSGRIIDRLCGDVAIITGDKVLMRKL